MFRASCIEAARIEESRRYTFKAGGTGQPVKTNALSLLLLWSA